jgi:ATP-dependent Clp protease ATP-binding subunit ClpC
MFERFTDRARKVMALANQEAHHFNHEYIGTEHILLGLIKEDTGVGATVLKDLGVDLQGIRNEVENMVGSGPAIAPMGKLPHIPQAKVAIEQAIAAARGLNHHYVGTEHILLGLLAATEGIAHKVLAQLGVKTDEVRRRIAAVTAGATDPEGTGFAADVPLTSASERMLRDAWTEARERGGRAVRPEHLLLGLLLQAKEGTVAEILREHWLAYEKVRERLYSRGP